MKLSKSSNLDYKHAHIHFRSVDSRIGYVSCVSSITGSAVALHCCKAHSKINTKMGNLTPCKIVTPRNYNLKLCIRDYVGEATHHAYFGSNRYTGGFSPYRRNITTLWLFVLTVLFSRKEVPFGGQDDGWRHLGEIYPQNPSKMGVNRQFQAKTAKYKNYNISELMNPIKIKFEDQLQTNNCTSRVV